MVGGFVGELLVNELLSLFHWDKVALRVAFVNLAGTHNLVVGIVDKFVPVSEPSGQTGQGEENGEHLGGDAQGLVDDSGVEVNVRVELSRDKELVIESDSLELHSDVDHWFTADNGENIIGNLPDDSGAGVEVLVNAMTEAHEDLLAVLDILNELGDSIDSADLVEHAEDSLVCTTMAGSVKGSNSTSETSVYI